MKYDKYMKIIIFLSHNRCNVVNEFLLFCKKISI